MLPEIFAEQLQLQRGVYRTQAHQEGASDQAVIDHVKDCVLAATDELHEALNEVSWKPWQSATYIRKEAFCGEIVDCLHFLVSACLAVGVSAEDLYAGYQAKALRNQARQEAGYTGLEKCPWCRRALDDGTCDCVDLDHETTTGGRYWKGQ